MNQLDNLKQFSTIVLDSGDIKYIERYKPKDVTTNPSLILKIANHKKYHKLFTDAIQYARKKGGDKQKKIVNAFDKLTVNIGSEILKHIPGRISTEIDARLSFNSELSIKKAKKIINLYQEQNINKSRILIKIATTWEGVLAAKQLEQENINCNLTLIFSFTQARICAEAGVYLISPFVGRIYDWYNNNIKAMIPYCSTQDPGINKVKKIYHYFKKYDYHTIVMSASFRKIEQILALAGCDSLTISPYLLETLYKNNQTVEQKLFTCTNKLIKPTPLSEPEFRWKHNKNIMAIQKLAEGICLFTQDQEKLENILIKEL